MVSGSWRYVGAAAGFGFGVVWMTVGIGSAILVVLCAALGYSLAFVAQHERADLSRRGTWKEARPVDDEPFLLDDLEIAHYERHDDEPPAEEEREPAAAQVEYGWPTS
jgi:hypothetical protein